MKLIRKTMFASVLLLLFGSTIALAEVRDYAEADFKRSLESGDTVVLDFHAAWCPTCRAQAKAFGKLDGEGALEGVTVYKVDYDKEKELRKKHSVVKQSTLILFKDGEEVDRSMGTSGVNELRAFVSKGE